MRTECAVEPDHTDLKSRIKAHNHLMTVNYRSAAEFYLSLGVYVFRAYLMSRISKVMKKTSNYYAAGFGVCFQLIIKTSPLRPDASDFIDSSANVSRNESNRLN